MIADQTAEHGADESGVKSLNLHSESVQERHDF